MTAREKVLGALFVVALVITIAFARMHEGDSKRLAAADAVKRTNDARIAEQQKAIEQRDRDIVARDAAAAKEAAKYEAIKKRITSGRAAVAALPELVDLPAPPQEIKPADLPSAPGMFKVGDFVVTSGSMAVLGQRLAQCKEDETNLRACQGDKTDLKTNYETATAQLKEERETAKAQGDAAHGGSRWQRLGRGLKQTACAAAGAGLGSRAKNPTQGAVVGAAAGALVCSIF